MIAPSPAPPVAPVQTGLVWRVFEVRSGGLYHRFGNHLTIGGALSALQVAPLPPGAGPYVILPMTGPIQEDIP